MSCRPTHAHPSRPPIAIAPLAPFKIRSFRFQWPADLLTAWAFEMETLILGWYILVETDSVLLLTVFGSLQFVGTLIAPMLGAFADRLGRRTLLCLMRGFYAVMAVVVMTLGLTDQLNAVYVFITAALMGLVRPSDLVMRNTLVADTIPADRLANAMGLTRATQDSARIAGALAGAGLFSALGIGVAYIFVAAFYLASLTLTFGVSRVRPGQAERANRARTLPRRRFPIWRELREGLAYIWATPRVLAIMCLAFMVNLTAYPISHGLLPFVAKEIYQLDENGLAHLVAGFGVGALTASILMAFAGGARRPVRFMVVCILLWYSALLLFGQATDKVLGLPTLFLIGITQGVAMLSMSVALLSTVTPALRGRVMGVRSMAIYGLPIGLVASGAMIEWIGFTATVNVYCAVGIFFTLLVSIKWRDALWR